MKYIIVLFFFFSLFIKTVSGQVAANNDISVNIKEIVYFTSDPCNENGMVSREYFLSKKKANLLKITPCNPKDKKYKGKIYLEVISDGKLYNVPIDEISFNEGNDMIIEKFRDFNLEERQEFYRSNKKYNDDYFLKILQEKEMFEAEQKRIREEEIKRQEEERKQNELRSLLIQKEKDSLTADQLIERMAQLRRSQIEMMGRVDQAIKIGQQKGGILITQFEVPSNDYGVTGFNVGIFNCSNKRIKYATFKLQAYNPVDDKIGGIESVKGVGFIESKEQGYWEFENVWFSDILETVKIVSITILYEDGSTKTISDIGPIRYDESTLTPFLDKPVMPEVSIYGSVSLDFIGGDIKSIFMVYYDEQNEMHTITFIDKETKECMSNLESAIHSAENLESNTFGIFRTKTGLPYIYLIQGEGTGILKINDAKDLLAKLKSYL
jgi:hypothetical protein